MADHELTKYEAIQHTIERQIADGSLNIGDRLPSRGTLARRHNVSQAPVRQAIRELTRQGVIRTKAGRRGLFVVGAPRIAASRSPIRKSADLAVAYATIEQLPSQDHAPLISQLLLEAMTEQVMHGGPALRRMPYRLGLTDHDDRPLRDALAGHRAVVFIGSDYVHWAEYLQSVGTACLYVTALWVPDQLNVVVHDVAGTQTKVIEHLISLGHREIGFLGNVNAAAYESNKFLVWYRTLVANGLKPNSDWVTQVGIGGQIEGYMAARELLERLVPGNRPTAIVADTDHKAVGAIAAIREKGLRVPEDMSVTGLDNRSIARVSDPPLTTAGARWSEAGRVILQAVESISAAPDHRLRVQLPVEMVIRASTAPPATASMV